MAKLSYNGKGHTANYTFETEKEKEISNAVTRKVYNEQNVASQANIQRKSILNRLNSVRYMDKAARMQLQKDIYDYDANLGILGALGYDITDSKKQLEEIRKVNDKKSNFFRQFKDENSYFDWSMRSKYQGKKATDIDSIIKNRTVENTFPALIKDDEKRETDWLLKNRDSFMTNDEILSEIKRLESKSSELTTERRLQGFAKFGAGISGDADTVKSMGVKYDNASSAETQNNYRLQQLKTLLAGRSDFDAEKAYKEADKHNIFDVLSDDYTLVDYANDKDSKRIYGNAVVSQRDKKNLELIDSNADLLSDLKKYGDNINIQKYVGSKNSIYPNKDAADAIDRNIQIADKWKNSGFDFDSLFETFTKRENAEFTEDITGWAKDKTKEHYVLSNIASVGTNLIGGIAALPNALESAVRDMTTDDIVTTDTNAPEWALKNITDTIRDTSNETILNEGMFGSGKLKKLSSFLYSTGMSMADFLATTAVTGFTEPVSLAIMGMNSAVDTVKNVTERGGSATDALLSGAAAGIFEVLFEKISVENLFRSVQTSSNRKYLYNIIKGFFSEGSEEFFTDVANAAADAIININNSEFNNSVIEYMANGSTAAEAKSKALTDKIKDMGLSFAGGALSGGIMATAGGGFGLAKANKAYSEIGNSVINEGGTDTLMQLAREYAEGNADIQYDIKAAEKFNKKQYNKEFNTQQSKTITDAVKTRLAQLGMPEAQINNTATEITEAYIKNKSYDGENRIAKRIFSELTNAEDTENFTSDWAKTANENAEYTAKQNVKDKYKASDVGRLYADVQTESTNRIESSYNTEMKKSMQTRLEELGMDKSTSGRGSEILLKAVNNQKLTLQENRLLNKNPQLARAYAEIQLTGSEYAERNNMNKWFAETDSRVSELMQNELNNTYDSRMYSVRMEKEIKSKLNDMTEQEKQHNSAVINSTGEETMILDIAEKTDSGIVVNLDDGTQAVISDNEEDINDLPTVTLNDKTTASLIRIASDYKTPITMNTFIKNARTAENLESYTRDFNKAYMQGIKGEKLNTSGFTIGDEAAKAAYTAGRGDAKITLGATSGSSRIDGMNFIGTVRSNSYASGVTRLDSNKKLSYNKRKQLDVLDSYGKKHGISFITVDTLRSGKGQANGIYLGDNKIVLALDAEAGAILSVAGHEVFHYIKNQSTEQAKLLQDFVIDTLKKNEKYDYQQRFDELKKRYGTENADVINEEIAANAMFDVLSNEKKLQTLAEENTSLFEKIHDAIKKFIEDIKSIIADLGEKWNEVKALKDDVQALESIYAMFDSVVWNIDENNKNTADEGGELKYSIVESVIDDNGNTYHDVVLLDSTIFKGLKPRNWGKKFLNFVYHNLINTSISVLDENGEQEQIVFAKENERVTKDGANNSHRVIDKLARKTDNNSRIVIVQANEVAFVSKYENKTDEHNHQWLDENGWEHRKAFAMTNKGDILSVTLSIAKAKDGRNILYDINKIHKVGHGAVPSDVSDKRGSHINPDFTDNRIAQDEPIVNSHYMQKGGKDTGKFSLAERDNQYLAAVNSGDMKTAQRLVDEAAKNAGYTERLYHGSKNGGGFTRFKDWQYFTPDKEYAMRYTDNDSEDSLYGVYAKFENPFDTRISQIRDIYENEFYGVYSRTDLQESGLPDWTDGYDLVDFFEENDYDYDAILLDEGGDPTENGVKKRGISYVIKKSAQIKSSEAVTYDDNGNVIPLSERFNAENADIRYSLKDDEKNKHRRKGSYYNESATLFMQWANSESTPVGDTKAFKYKNKLHFYEKTENGCIELTRKQYNEIRNREVGEIYGSDRTRNRTDNSDEGNENAKRGRVQHNAIYRHSGDDIGTVSDIQNEEFQNDGTGNLERSGSGSKKTSEKLSLKENQDIIEAHERLLSENKNLRTANQILREEFSRTDGHTFGTKARNNTQTIAKRLIRQYKSTANAEDIQRKIYDTFEFLARNGDVTAATESLIAIGEEVITESEFADSQTYAVDGMNGADIYEAATSFAYNAIGQFMKYVTPTFADKQAYKLEKTVDKYETALKKARARQSEIIRAKNAKIAETKKHYQDMISRQREKREDTKQRAKMRKHTAAKVNRLANLLLNPTETKHIPEGLHRLVADFVNIFTEDSVILDEGKIARLRDNYEKYFDSDNADTAMYDPDIIKNFAAMAEIAEEITEGKRLSDLNITETQLIENITDHFYKLVRDANKVFFGGKKQNRIDIALSAIENLKNNDPKLTNGAFKIMTQNLTPYYFFNHLGGPFETAWGDVLDGQHKWGLEMYKARNAVAEMINRHRASEWIDDESKSIKLTTQAGDNLELTVNQALGIYATAKRESTNGQNAKHLSVGGVVFDDADVTPKPLSAEDISVITNVLTKAQITFADDMIKYLSTDMARLGNDASMRMFGYNKFTEQNYYPFHIAENSKNTEKNNGINFDNAAMLKNKSFAKSTVRGANAPVKVENFTEVCGKHISEMITYYALAEAQSNLVSLFNFKNTAEHISIKDSIENAFGAEYKQYFSSVITDMNSGVRGDPSEKFMLKMLGKFKKNAVAANLRVVIQQPSAIGRAMAVVDPKYFFVTAKKGGYEELKRYSGVAVIKEMGGFDTDTGRSNASWLMKTEPKGLKNKTKAFLNIKDSSYRDDIFGWGAAKADEVTWNHIWQAVKAEVRSTQKLSGEELLVAAGKRFNEVIEATQVYDSILSRSQMMRSHSTAVKMATSFMAEPTKTLNLLYDAVYRYANNRNKETGKYMMRALGSAFAASLLNVLLKSIVTAGRDDDENKSQTEKYIEAIISDSYDELSILQKIPYIKDIISLFQGYDVSRTDMDMIGDCVNAIEGIFDLRNDSFYEKTESEQKEAIKKAVGNLFGTVGAFTGIPLKNIIRDANGIINSFKGVFDDKKSTSQGRRYARIDGIISAFDNKIYNPFESLRTDEEDILKAIVNDDANAVDEKWDKYQAYLIYLGKDTDKAYKLVRKNVKEKLKVNVLKGKISDADAEKYLIKYLDDADGYWTVKNWHFDADEANEGLNFSKYNRLKGLVLNGENIDEAVKELTEHNTKENNVRNRVTSIIEEAYKNNEISFEDSKRLLNTYMGFAEKQSFSTTAIGSEKDVLRITDKWQGSKNLLDGEYYSAYDALDEAVLGGTSTESAKEKLYDLKYEDSDITGHIKTTIKNAYFDGGLTKSEVKSKLKKYTDTDSDEADEMLTVWDFKKNYPDSDLSEGGIKQFSKVTTGISLQVFTDYYEKRSKCEGTKGASGKTVSGSKKQAIMEVINSMPISSKQKDELYLLNNWSANTIYEAPWH